jgi:hypothetical protein
MRSCSVRGAFELQTGSIPKHWLDDIMLGGQSPVTSVMPIHSKLNIVVYADQHDESRGEGWGLTRYVRRYGICFSCDFIAFSHDESVGKKLRDGNEEFGGGNGEPVGGT